MTVVKQISAQDLQQKMQQQEVFLIDVRMPNEREVCDIGGVLMPLPEFGQHLEQIPRDKPVVLYCKLGGRSMQAAEFLIQQGYEDVWNLDGGILAWIAEVDSSLNSY